MWREEKVVRAMPKKEIPSVHFGIHLKLILFHQNFTNLFIMTCITVKLLSNGGKNILLQNGQVSFNVRNIFFHISNTVDFVFSNTSRNPFQLQFFSLLLMKIHFLQFWLLRVLLLAFQFKKRIKAYTNT